jgi:glycosyltransferase involved in cell wall biosynthesis
MGKIKLLYAIGSTSGGALKNVADLATHLDQERFEIFVVLSNNKQVAETQIIVSKIKKKGIRIKYIYISETISLMDIISFVRICFYLRKNKFDIIHAHSSKAGALFRPAAFLAKVSAIIYTPHCFYFTAFKGYKRKFYQMLERFLVPFTHRIVISGTEKKAAIECNMENDKISIIDNALDISEYDKTIPFDEMRQHWQIPFSHTVIVGVGRLVKQKNWEMFIKTAQTVLSKNKKVTFIIVGDGPCKNRLNKQIAQYGLESRIKLLGYIENISKVYVIADIFVSTSKWEGLPYTYLEAFYFEIPMIITNTDGLEYFIEKGNCTSVLQNDSNYLADKILEKISLLANELPLNKNCSFPFLLTNCIKQYEKLYHELYDSSK